MSDTNINCKHKQLIKSEKESIDFCKKCGCFLIIKYSKSLKEVESFAVLYKKLMNALDISPYDSFSKIVKQNENSDLSKFYSKIPEEYFQIRKSMTDLLKDYVVEHNFGTRSFFLGVYILDYIFCKHSYADKLAQLKTDMLVLGVFLVAVKFIDDDAYPPTLDSFTNKKNPSLLYSLSEVRKYECIVVNLMDFKLDIFTSYYLTETMLSHGVVFTNELNSMGIIESRSIKDKIKKINRLALDINKMFIEDIESLKFSSLQIAATSIMMAKELLKFQTSWNPELRHLYKIEDQSLNFCYNSILR